MGWCPADSPAVPSSRSREKTTPPHGPAPLRPPRADIMHGHPAPGAAAPAAPTSALLSQRLLRQTAATSRLSFSSIFTCTLSLLRLFAVPVLPGSPCVLDPRPCQRGLGGTGDASLLPGWFQTAWAQLAWPSAVTRAPGKEGGVGSSRQSPCGTRPVQPRLVAGRCRLALPLRHGLRHGLTLQRLDTTYV